MELNLEVHFRVDVERPNVGWHSFPTRQNFHPGLTPQEHAEYYFNRRFAEGITSGMALYIEVYLDDHKISETLIVRI